MNEEGYLKERLDDQLTWYSKKSQHNRKWFKRLRLMEIVSAALIPFLSGMGDKVAYSQWIIGGLGVGIAIAAAITALFKYQENWIEYRTTAEQLKHEKYVYLTNAKPYDTEEKFHLLVERVESLISKENSAWASMARKQSNVEKKA
ncbi:MAG: DUF4231 domain-containing protein [Gammaproteobacteria bacterium]|nr:DUF4231 domain-containing protein [Gammaproteobacteria bacterium]